MNPKKLSFARKRLKLLCVRKKQACLSRARLYDTALCCDAVSPRFWFIVQKYSAI